ncbi:MAG: SsrA-binding protein SmpB [Oligoflexia bacterium]|nr:SsrA-binding protein SmpB [Oligoflexia bacterium]
MGKKIIAKNKRASYDFALEDRFEAGLVLQGTEVKSIRAGKVTIAESYITIDNNMEAWIYNMNVAHYEFGNINNHDERRKRKLLLNRKEIETIFHEMKSKNMTIVPTIIYFTNNRVKLEIALAKGKKMHDKRQDKAKKDVERKLRRGDYS